MYKTIDEALTDLNWEYLKSEDNDVIEEINKIFDNSVLDKDRTPKIVTNKKTVIVCDNKKFNETYIIDIVNNFLRLNSKNIDLIYCDSIKGRCHIQNVKYDSDKSLTSEYISEIEHNKLCSQLIVINPTKQAIVSLKDNFGPLTISEVKNLLKYLDDEHCDKMMKK